MLNLKKVLILFSLGLSSNFCFAPGLADMQKLNVANAAIRRAESKVERLQNEFNRLDGVRRQMIGWGFSSALGWSTKEASDAALTAQAAARKAAEDLAEARGELQAAQDARVAIQEEIAQAAFAEEKQEEINSLIRVIIEASDLNAAIAEAPLVPVDGASGSMKPVDLEAIEIRVSREPRLHKAIQDRIPTLVPSDRFNVGAFLARVDARRAAASRPAGGPAAGWGSYLPSMPSMPWPSSYWYGGAK